MSITKRTIKGITYLIERISYRDEQGRPRTKDKVIGKVDAQTGEIVLTRKGKNNSQITPNQSKDDVIIPEIVDDSAEKPYKTEAKAKAGSDARISDANIHSLALPTFFEFENAISLYSGWKSLPLKYHRLEVAYTLSMPCKHDKGKPDPEFEDRLKRS
ncbi:MAG: hypothetical protein IJG51_11190 [Synergistaceae bacterium]|nr:hypothetical protein [Synergistaceae bacterium]MBR0185866.1 hypothetical protein [Synergistaceae bacterium]